MSAVTESVTQRMTLEQLAADNGFDLVPNYAGDVTITALVDDVESVIPGSLFIAQHPISRADINEIVNNGAYAMLLPESMKTELMAHGASQLQIPVLFANITTKQLAALASQLAGAPSDSVAVFALTGPNQELLADEAKEVARFLHMLGNPVGIINAEDSQSLERFIELNYPIDVLSMQRAMAVCAEDGAAAVIVTMDDATLDVDAMASVAVDVLACDGVPEPTRARDYMDQMAQRYGCAITKDTRLVMRTEESDTMALQAGVEPAQVRALSFAIAMGLAVGVRKSSIRSALRVAGEFHEQ